MTRARTRQSQEPPPPIGDAELLERVAQREREAGGRFFDRYGAEIYGFLVRRAPAQEAEDLLQEVFLRALRGASTFRGTSSVRTWLYGIARNVLLERSRARISFDTFVEVPDPAVRPEHGLAERDERRRLVSALATLPDEQAIVLELHRIDGLKHDEIAEVLGIKVATARKRLQRAHAALAAAFERGGDARPLSPHSRIESWRASLLRRALPDAPNRTDRRSP